MSRLTRRQLFAGAMGAVFGSVSAAVPVRIPLRPLGKTEVKVPMLALGCGSAFMAMSDEEAERYLQRALELGITYWDTAHSYGRGQSEVRLGRVLKTERARVFLATKTAARTYEAAAKEVELSLKRLQTDRLDLLQIHNWGPNDDPSAIGRKDGVLTLLRKLREEKVVRFLGITGHATADGLRKVLELYDDFDTVLMPINPANPEFEEQVVPIAKQKGIAVLAMKVLGQRALLERADAQTLLRYAWSAPVASAVVGMTGTSILEANAHHAAAFKPMSNEEHTKWRQTLQPLRSKLPY